MIKHGYTIPKPPHGSQEWLNARWQNDDGQARITASVAAVVHNEHRFTTPADLAVELLAKTPPVPKEQNDAMRRGTILEGPLMLWASEILNVTITEPQELFCYEEEGVRLMATLDGKDLSGKIYELKTYNKRWNGQLPPYWKWQGVQQAICADANEIIWIVFDSDLQLQFHTQTVTSDERQQHIDAVRKFLGFIDMGMMPEGADPTYDNASALYPEGYENTVVLGHEVYNTLERLSIAKEQIKSAEAVRDQLQGELGMLLGDAEYGSIDGVQVISWKNSSRTSFDAKQFEKEHPALHAKFKKTSTFRTMRITAKESK
jgi:hypothetical protein